MVEYWQCVAGNDHMDQNLDEVWYELQMALLGFQNTNMKRTLDVC
uniref:Uncharacterized protein n=1 Tax=Arundo donax TaxID=35708 RepID=A0A0A8Y8N3_ARUDO